MAIERKMGDVINLRKARKGIERRQHQDVAAANRLLHGRSKASREVDKARIENARRNLDQHRMETGDKR